MMNGPTSPAIWRMPQSALRSSMAEMARDGARDCEGIALWLGRRHENVAEITHVVGLRGPGVHRRPDYLSITPELLNDVTDAAIELGVFLVGQIHSHPPGAGVGLSPLDQRFGIRAQGYLSAVAPNFAARLDTPTSACGFHLFEGGTWRRFGPEECVRRVEVFDDVPSTPLIIIGGDHDQ
ncbi:MAG: hypothetical protein ACREEW_09115 [Caulobacteraceae bacterium]